MADYTIYPKEGSSFVSLTGGNAFEELDEHVKSLVCDHYQLVFAVLVILLLCVLWMWFKWAPIAQGFNPGQTLRAQQRDDTGATNVIQNNGVGIVASQQATVAPQPGTAAYDILNSPDYNCAGRTPVGNNAWAYMTQVAYEKDASGSTQSESFGNGNINNVPVGDNRLTAIMAGH